MENIILIKQLFTASRQASSMQQLIFTCKLQQLVSKRNFHLIIIKISIEIYLYTQPNAGHDLDDLRCVYVFMISPFTHQAITTQAIILGSLKKKKERIPLQYRLA
jgi:hypothetical protein